MDRLSGVWETWNECAAAGSCQTGNFDMAFSVTIDDSAGTVDSDGDGVSDDVDAFPNDPTRAVDCPAGYYGAFECTAAPIGTYVATSGQLAATPCPVGTFSGTEASVACTPAPIGYYVDFVGAAEAILCPAGTSTVATGSVSLSDCLTDSDGDGIPDIVDTDDDNDGVLDTSDLCPATTLPEVAPSGWKQNHYVADASGSLVDPNGKEAGVTISDTAGCSGAQIIDAAGLGKGLRRFGITRGALQDWLDSLG